MGACGKRSTQRLCTRVSIAMRPRLLEFGLPGRPLGRAKDIEPVFENWRRRSSDAPSANIFSLREGGKVDDTYSGLQTPGGYADVPQSGSHAHVDFPRTSLPNL
jgi:hypothetical protein